MLQGNAGRRGVHVRGGGRGRVSRGRGRAGRVVPGAQAA